MEWEEDEDRVQEGAAEVMQQSRAMMRLSGARETKRDGALLRAGGGGRGGEVEKQVFARRVFGRRRWVAREREERQYSHSFSCGCLSAS